MAEIPGRRELENRFSELVREYGPSLQSLTRRTTHDEQTAQDIIQDVFLKLWQTRAAWKFITNMEAWLYRVTENRVIDHLRKKSSAERYRRSLQYGSANFDQSVQVEWREEQDLLSKTVRQHPGHSSSAELDAFYDYIAQPEGETALRELLHQTYAGIRHHSATLVDAAGNLIPAPGASVLPHLINRKKRRTRRRRIALVAAFSLLAAAGFWWFTGASAEQPMTVLPEPALSAGTLPEHDTATAQHKPIPLQKSAMASKKDAPALPNKPASLRRPE